MSTLVRERPTTPAGHRPSPPPPESTWRLRHFAACVLLTAFAFNNSSGLIVGDTKLDLAVRPWAFLGRALSMWDPQDSAGQVQNQAYGYLFPMGPFFGIGQSAHLPMWAVQRLWWAVLLCTAFLGVVALARRLGVGSPASRMIAGLAFALSPHVLSVLGPVSAEAQPMCLAPWVLVPLVDGMRGGSARRAAMRSGLAVLLMGAINAALVLAALVPAALWLLAHRPDPRMRRLAGAWVLAVGLATAWWVTPLILFGQYGVPFLGRIEQATTTTSTATLVETIRGTSDWVGYLPGSGWRAAALLLTSPAVIVETVAVAALGLAGLASRRMPYRGWLVACLLVGTVAICAGYLGTVHGLFAPEVQQLLDSSLAPLRNVHKFDVVLRLPLALGLAHVAGRLSWGQAAERRVSRVLLVAVAAVAVVGAATPLLALRIAPAGAFASVPRYWTQAANWLTARNAAGRALLVPGSRFGTYVWGRPMDEPLEPLADTPWEVRAAVPLATPGHVRLLDAVDAELAAGRPSAGLAAALARSGITYLVVRNDLDQPATETSRPVVVHEALAGSPGLRLVRSFGPPVGQDALFGRVVDQHLQLPYHAVEIWHVAGPRERRVSAAPVSSVTQVSGGPESLLPLSGAGLPVGAPTVLTGDAPASLHPKQVVLTDGMRRREADYGAGSQDTSATLAPGDPRRLAGPERDWLPFRGLRHQTYVRYLGARAIRASSSGSDANAFGGPNRLSSPYSAFDGSPRTAWTSNLATRGVGEWLEIDFDHPRVLHHVRVRFAESSTATRVRVDTSSGHAAAEVSNGTWLSLPVPAGTSSFLRITVTAVQPGAGFRPVAISEVSIPGVHVARTLVMPDDLAPGTRVDQVLINATDDARNRCVFVATRPLCAVGLGSLGEEFTGLDRTFDLPAGGRYRFTAVAVPRADAALLKVLAAAVHPSITAHASSHAIGDPLARPEAAVDVDLGTGWIAAADDPRPTITLRWAHPRTISSLTIVTDPLLAATPPDQVRLSSAQGSREATIARDGAVRFAPITTRRIRLTLTSSTGLLANINPFGGAPQWLGIGVSEIAVDGVPATSRAASDPLPVDLPCGAGPTVKVDGTPFYTRVHTTVAALRDRRPVPVVVCAPGGVIRLRTGWHRIQVHSTALWTPTALRLQRTPAAPPPLPGLPVQVRSWGATDRAVAIGSRASETVVTVHENVNAGWHAAIDGKPLTPITVDGWEQGYLVPAGPAAVIELHYAPDDWYRTALVAGLVAALLLVAAAFARPRRPRTATLPPARTWRADGRGGPALVALSLAVAVLVAGPAGAATWAAVGAVAVLARAGVRRRPWLRHVLPALAAGSYAAAGLVLAVRHWNLPGYAGGTVVVQLLCVAALVATAWTPLRLPTRVSRPPSAARAPLMIPEEQPAPELDGDDSAPAGAAN